jgi:phosphoserine phosphatase
MTQNEITGLMRDAGFDNLPEADYWYPSFKHFAKLVAQNEREACAKVCESMNKYMDDGEECATAIRARGQA